MTSRCYRIYAYSIIYTGTVTLQPWVAMPTFEAQKKRLGIYTSGLLSELQREFKNKNNSDDVSVMVICFYILGLRMRKAI